MSQSIHPVLDHIIKASANMTRAAIHHRQLADLDRTAPEQLIYVANQAIAAIELLRDHLPAEITQFLGHPSSIQAAQRRILYEIHGHRSPHRDSHKDRTPIIVPAGRR